MAVVAPVYHYLRRFSHRYYRCRIRQSFFPEGKEMQVGDLQNSMAAPYCIAGVHTPVCCTWGCSRTALGRPPQPSPFHTTPQPTPPLLLLLLLLCCCCCCCRPQPSVNHQPPSRLRATAAYMPIHCRHIAVQQYLSAQMFVVLRPASFGGERAASRP